MVGESKSRGELNSVVEVIKSRNHPVDRMAEVGYREMSAGQSSVDIKPIVTRVKSIAPEGLVVPLQIAMIDFIVFDLWASLSLLVQVLEDLFDGSTACFRIVKKENFVHSSPKPQKLLLLSKILKM
jgi:hypothetical protein